MLGAGPAILAGRSPARAMPLASRKRAASPCEDANGKLGYDAAGNVTAYQYEDATSGRIDQYTVSYLKKDGYLEAATRDTSNTQNVHPATDESVYNERGERIALTQHVANAENVVNDMGVNSLRPFF